MPAKAKYWTVHDELVGHLRRYEKADLMRMLEDAGFVDVEVDCLRLSLLSTG